MKRKVFVAIPTTQNVIDSQGYVLREMEELYKDHIEFIYPDQCVRRVFHDFARNMLVEEFLASDADILWFLDSDITPNKYVLDLVAIYGDKWDIAGATYPVFMAPAGSDMPEVVFTCYEKNPQTGNYSLRKVPYSGQELVDGLATGCLFVKREVFKKLSKPYFEFKYKTESREIAEGEDLGFVRKVNDLGYKFFTDFSYACKHQKSIDLLDANNYAIEYANRAVIAYDAQIKRTLQSAIDAAYNKGVQDMAKALKSSDKVQLKKTDLITPANKLILPK